MIIKADDILNAVKHGFQFQTLGGSYSYLNIENEVNLCPFCGEKMKATNSQGKWIQVCNCENGVNYTLKVSELLKKKSEIEVELDKIRNEVEFHALNVFKKYYQDVILPDLEMRQKIENQIILTIPFLTTDEETIQKMREQCQPVKQS